MIETSVAYMPLGPRGAHFGYGRGRYFMRDTTGWYRYKPVFLPMDEPGKGGKGDKGDKKGPSKP